MRSTFTLILILVACCVAPLVAKEEKRPSELYADKEEAFLRAVAAQYVKSGDALKKENLFQYARMLYEEALEYYPNDKDARKQLGFERKGREWVREPGAGLPESNTRPQGVSEQLFSERAKKKYEDLWDAAGLYAAKKYAGLGKWCRKVGLEDQAKKAFEKAIRLDTDNEAAREAMGYRKVGGKWLTEKQIKAREEAKEGKIVDTPSRVEEALGLKFNKMESLHFYIETVNDTGALRDYIKNCETTYAYFLRDVGEEELRDIWGGRKSNIVVLGSVEQWHRYVDLFSGGSEKNKALTKQCRGTRGDANLTGAQYTGEDGHTGTIDGLVHKVAHFLVYNYWGIRQAWLQEGFAYYYTVKVLDSTHTHCVALGDYNNPKGGMKDWGQSDAWKELVKKDVLSSGDPDLRMFYGQKTAALEYNSSVKAWSMISWLFDKHREKFMQWLQAVGHGGKKQEEAFQEVFGWSFEEVDNEWRAFVRENY